MGYLFIVAAIVAEVTGTLALRAAATGRRRFYAVVVAGYLTAFVALTFGLRNGVPLGVAYGIWAAAGVGALAVLAFTLSQSRGLPGTGMSAARICPVLDSVMNSVFRSWPP